MDASVVLAEPNDILRKGLSCSLAQSRRVRRVLEATDAEDAIVLVQRERVDVCILGSDAIGGEPRSLIEKLESCCPGIRTIVIVRNQTPVAIEHAMASGATCLLGASSSAKELWECIDRARAGRRYVSPELERSLIASVQMGREPGTTSTSRLTRRERTILQLIGEGQSNREIATRLGLSRRTVDTHRTRLMSKLSIHKTAGLVRMAVREGLVEP